MDRPGYTVGRFTLQPRRQLLGPDGPVALGRRALDLLSVLAEARGALVTKDELVGRVWSQSVVEDNALQVQVVALRKALGEDAGLLVTVRGLGYRLDGCDPCDADPPSPAEGTAAPALPPPPAVARRRGPRLAAAAAVAAAAVALVGVPAFVRFGRGPPTAREPGALPLDPVAAALFTQARDEWARRDAESLARSIVHFERVTRLDPGFAPAFADLADAYLLEGEVGSLPDAVAFDGAQHAADRALALDPGSAGADRAMGFIRYWWRHDRPGAEAAFRASLRLDPTSGQTHFWYANALADNGEFAAARREFDLARVADPGSDQIGADQAWAMWDEGRDAEARTALDAIVARDGDNAEALDCRSSIRLADGDAAGYLRDLRSLSRLRREPSLASRVASLAAAYDHGGAAALLRTVVAQEMTVQADAPYPDHSSAAFYASLAGDRPALVAALASADQGREPWGASGYVARMRKRWAGDPAVIAALDRRAAPRLEAQR